jgi:flavin-dependent dehydrogenase
VIDLLIAGGGPAGLATAIFAARAGLEPLVLEPRPAPIDKACGEGLMPAAVSALGALGVAPRGRPFLGVRYIAGKIVAEGRFARDERGLGVRRTVLHEALHARARALGIPLVEERVDRIRQFPDGVEAAGRRARFFVAADGLQSPIRRALGLEVPPRFPLRYGIRRHFAVAPWSDFVEVHWGENAEAYVTPLAEDLLGVAILFCGRGNFDFWLDRFPALRERLGAPCTPPLGAGPFERRARRRVAGRVFFVGDAAGFFDPITGEGVRLALDAAAALVRCVKEGRPAAYEASWRRLSRRYWLFTEAILRLGRRPGARAPIMRALRRFPLLFDGALRFFAGEKSSL